MGDIKERMLRAARLDVNLYEEVEADQGATRQAMWVVVMSAAAAGIGNKFSCAKLGRLHSRFTRILVHAD